MPNSRTLLPPARYSRRPTRWPQQLNGRPSRPGSLTDSELLLPVRRSPRLNSARPSELFANNRRASRGSRTLPGGARCGMANVVKPYRKKRRSGVNRSAAPGRSRVEDHPMPKPNSSTALQEATGSRPIAATAPQPHRDGAGHVPPVAWCAGSAEDSGRRTAHGDGRPCWRGAERSLRALTAARRPLRPHHETPQR